MKVIAAAAPASSLRLLSVDAVAEVTTLPRSTVYTLIAKGELPVVRNGRAVRVVEADLLAWIDARREQAPR